MKLKNLMEIANPNFTIMLSGIKEDGSEIGFDFIHNCWMDNNDFTMERLTTIGDFKMYRKYRSMKENRIEDFHIFRPDVVPAYKDLPIYEKKILKIKIFLMTGNSSIAKAIEARVNLLASKKIKEKEEGRIKHEVYKASKPKKRKWNYSPVKKSH